MEVSGTVAIFLIKIYYAYNIFTNTQKYVIRNTMTDTQSPLVLTAELYQRTINYLVEKPYKVSKEVIDNFKEVTDENGQKFYQIDRPHAIHLLDKIFLNEDIVFTYMHLRRGYENLIQSDAQKARQQPQETPSDPAKKEKRIVEVVPETVEEANERDNIAADIDDNEPVVADAKLGVPGPGRVVQDTNGETHEIPAETNN
jgi:hypothetical protein